VPDREIAARLAALRRESVDLERRLRGDELIAPDSEEYWRGQIGAWRGQIVDTLVRYPLLQRAVAQLPTSAADGDRWADGAIGEIIEVRGKLDSTIERLG
jgi:hypothetical protein